MQKKTKKVEFVQSVKIELIDSLKNKSTKYLLFFGDSCEEICNSKAFVDIATARRHHGLSIIYVKQNLFRIGRHAELQYTHMFSSISQWRDASQYA